MRLTNFEGDLFWDAADPENSVTDPEDAFDGMCTGDIVEFQQAQSLPNFFGVDLGEDASGVALYEFFTTKEEAEEASRLVVNPKCKHVNCGHPYSAHSREEYNGYWVWKNKACPVGAYPFHPTQTFKETT